MPDCFCVPDAGARCSSARAATAASSTAGHAAAASLGVNRCARRDAGISTRDAAGTVMPSASAATGAGAAKALCQQKVTHHGSAAPRCGAELVPSSVLMREASRFDVPQTGHQASSRSERHFQDALPLLRAPGQRVRAPSLATLADSSTSSPRRTALSGEHDGDQRRTQGADPALPLRRALAGGHHRLPARGPPLHRRAGAGRGRESSASVSASDAPRSSTPTWRSSPRRWSASPP